MLPVEIEKTACRTCNGTGFVWRGRVMQHETLSSQQGKTAVQVHVSRIRDLCPECRGTGVHLHREIQRTPWALILRH